VTSPHERLDEAMNGRRLDLGMTWGELAVTAKIAEVTLRAIRRGANLPTSLTKRRLEDALEWEHGSIEAILAGGEPLTKAVRVTEAAVPEREPTARDLADQMTELMTERDRDRAEHEQRIRRLEEEVEHLKGQQSG